MLSRIVFYAINSRYLVLITCIAMLIVGIRNINNAPIDVFPEFAPLKVEVQTEAPGLSTDEIESLITIPLERGLNGIPHLKTLRSKSVLGLSSVVMLFDASAASNQVRQQTQERIALVSSQLPTLAKSPVILPPLSSLSRVMKIGVSSSSLSQIDLTSLVMWTVKPKLMSMPGVANVAVWGQRDKQFQILVNPDRLKAAGVTLRQVLNAAGDATAIDSGGFIDTPNQRFAVHHSEFIHDISDLERVVVDVRNGVPVRLGNIANVTVGAPPTIGSAIINGGQGLLLIVEKLPEANTLELTRQVETALANLGPALNNVKIDTTIFRPASFIERAVKNLKDALIIGAVLVALIIIAFLNNWRAACISLLAIPLSILFAILILTSVDATLNTMVIAGLVIALGEVVDDSIIDVENIMRRLRLNANSPNPASKLSVIVAASLEVRSAVVYATAVVIMVFLPILFLDGVAGSFFHPLAKAYIIAIAGSLLVALTVTPALCFMLLSDKDVQQTESRLVIVLKKKYLSLLRSWIDKTKYSIALLCICFVSGLIGFKSLGNEFLPEFQETDFLMHFLERPGTSLEQMEKMTIRASKDLLAIPGVRNFGSHIGRAEAADEVVGPNFTELWISIDPGVDYKKTVDAIKESMHGYAGIFTDVQTYLKERSKEVLTGTSASIVVRLFGNDMEVLRSKAEEIKGVMQGVEGVADLKVESQVMVPQIEIKLNANAVERYGINAGDIRRITSTLLRGSKVGEVYPQQQRVDVVVWGEPSVRQDIAAISALPIETPSGMQLRLRDIASINVTSMPNEIKREAASRRLDIIANAQGRDVGSVAADIEAKVKQLSFPQGYYPQFLGEHQAQAEAKNRLFGLSLIAFLVILLIIYSDFKSIRHTLLIALSLPFALIGGVIAVLLTGGIISLGSIVGLIAVLGIAARNGIMLISHYRHLEDQESIKFDLKLLERGSSERLIPILMTAIATGLALLPIALGGQKSGYEIEFPLALVVIGGLTTSTILNLFLMPSLYYKFGKRNTVKL